jgi:hypothetical protein
MTANRRTAHLIYGPTAAGKSTYARKLAAEAHGVRFSIDEWMHALFGADVPERMDMSWVTPRVSRCQAQVSSVARQILGKWSRRRSRAWVAPQSGPRLNQGQGRTRGVCGAFSLRRCRIANPQTTTPLEEQGERGNVFVRGDPRDVRGDGIVL